MGPTNAIDAIHEVLRANRLQDARVTAPHGPARRDLNLFGIAGPAARPVLGEIADLDQIGQVSGGTSARIGLRLADSFVVEIGEALERGAPGALGSTDIASDKRLVVDYCDPNATKALHVGHLRNISLGNAIANLGRACGSAVTTQSQVGDIGRSIGEAMAGYMLYGDDQDPATQGEKGDRFVGRYYTEFVRSIAESDPLPQGRASDVALAREDMDREDLASELVDRLRDREPVAVSLWQKIRGWAIEGQEQTLTRLGANPERFLFESDFLQEIESTARRLVDAGVAEEAPNGAILHRTGEPNYPILVLRRPDGHSTQHLRYVALWTATQDLLDGHRSLEVMGDEWHPLAVFGERMMASLSSAAGVHPTECILHGMVATGGDVVKSSAREPLLIDDLLDDLRRDPRVLEAAAGDPATAERLAVTACLGFFLSAETVERVSITPDLLPREDANAGWAMARAALLAWNDEYDGEPDPAPEERSYRFVTAQSQIHRQLVRLAFEEVRPAALMRFHSHLSRWFLDAPTTPRLARAMRTITSAGAAALGLPILARTDRELQPAGRAV
jgi:arginyl-tRNA synthetase